LKILSTIQVIVIFLLWWVRVLWSALPMICPESH
jgi:hypothetical protein